MTAITAKLVSELRERSGAGMMDCKKALVENNGDIEAAVEYLRKTGLAKADKKASRVAAEGLIAAASANGQAVLVEINSETDFVAKAPNFKEFADSVADVALKSGAADVDALKAAAHPAGGSVEEATKAQIATIGENIQVRRMVRIANDGPLATYLHGGRIGVIVALKGGSEELAKGIAMHVAAMNPPHIKPEDVPAEFIAKEKDIALSQMTDKDKAKPAEILEKIISGKINKIVSEVTLVGQPYVLDTNVTVGDALKKEGADVVAVARLVVGEGIEKVQEDYLAEVQKAMQV
ncbi:translation elongation factor Ts [Dyella sp. RRB7]|uniref:translation elongation factor Ts n=1 Tax=Dyella sp. RRB7 TaxID=2919502 RepID=UPI001FAA42BA|nr:translation elongation factor Ts [Dyella sp. RRB7]